MLVRLLVLRPVLRMQRRVAFDIREVSSVDVRVDATAPKVLLSDGYQTRELW